MKRRDRVLARNVRRRLARAERLFEQRRRRRGARVGNMKSSISASSLLSLLSNDEDDDVVDGDDDGGSIGGASGGGEGGGGSPFNMRNKTKDRVGQRNRQRRLAYESAHHERVRFLARGGKGGGGGGKGNGARKRFYSDSSRGSSADDRGGDGGEDETDESMGGGSSIDGDEHPNRSRTRADRFQMLDSHTLPNFAMESVCHDQMPFAHGEIKKVPYVHGVSMLCNNLLSLSSAVICDLIQNPRHPQRTK